MKILLSKAVYTLGLSNVAKACGVSYQAVRKWEKKGLPRTEWTGETRYAEAISNLSNGQFAKDDFLTTKKAA